MGRSGPICLCAAVTLLTTWTVRAEPVGSPGSDAPPLTYDLMINGENFTVQANRRATLKSQKKPGVTYEVAVQIALQQHIRLSRLEFDYEWPASVQETRGVTQRTVRIRHELGFTVLVTDLGPAVDSKAQEETLKIAANSVSESLKESGMKNMEVAASRDWKFANSAGRGIRLHYEDNQATPQTAMLFVLSAPNFTASCLVQYFDANADNVLPLVKRILDSLRAVPKTPPI